MVLRDDLIRVTRAGAQAAYKWFGRGDKVAADEEAVKAMREAFGSVAFNGEVIIGEGEKDEAPMLFIGEKLGDGSGEKVEIAVDPLECTTYCAEGKQGSMCILATGSKGSLRKLPGTYFNRVVGGPKLFGKLDITKSVEENLDIAAKALGKPIEEVTVAVLKRERHDSIIEACRKKGCRVILHDAGTIAMDLATCDENSDIDITFGWCGTPEAVMTAVGLKNLGGDIQGIVMPHKEEFRKQAVELGVLDKVLNTDDLAASEGVLVATGISSSRLVRGFDGKRWYSVIITKGKVEYEESESQ